MTRAASVTDSTASCQEAGPGSTPRAALQALQVRPISFSMAKVLLKREHYLHSLPGGTQLAFGVFLENGLLGAMTLGTGPALTYRLVEGASPDDCVTLTRLWLSDKLPANSESRVLGIMLRALKNHTGVKFVVSYADPWQGHLGIIYQATNWLYTGLSEATPLYDLGDGRVYHSRSLSHVFGTHSVSHFAACGVAIKRVPQTAKHRYLFFLDPAWRPRLRVPALPYPKHAGSVAPKEVTP